MSRFSVDTKHYFLQEGLECRPITKVTRFAASYMPDLATPVSPPVAETFSPQPQREKV
jgi:hypothetical protein